MTDAELAAVCARHAITVHDLSGGFYATDAGLVGDWTDTNRADAVCALLKARYGVTTEDDTACLCPWRALLGGDADGIEALADTELAAVVSLADRLAGVS
jgi:hypothetical protein